MRQSLSRHRYIAVMKTVQPGPPNIADLKLDRACLNMAVHNKVSAMVNNYWKYAPSFDHLIKTCQELTVKYVQKVKENLINSSELLFS